MIQSIYKTKKKCQGAPYGSYPRIPTSLATPLMSGENRKERKKKVNLGACGPRNYKYKFLCQLQIFKYKGNKGH